MSRERRIFPIDCPSYLGNCAIKNLAGLCSGAGNYCPIGAKAADDRSFTVTGQKSNKADTDVNLAGLKNNLTTDGFAFQFNIVECTQNSHCTADPNKAKCNTGITTNFPQNTCIDSVPPTSTIESEANFAVVGSARTLNQKASDGTYWLKADTYTIDITNGDTHPFASGLDYCRVVIYDGGVVKRNEIISPCSASTSILLKVGPKDSPLADCKAENEVGGIGQCLIWITPFDKAGNEGLTSQKPLRIDLTAPTAQ